MPGITGQGTTFNLPNYVGELFAATPEDTPFLSAIGGLTGGRPTNSVVFSWSGYDLRDPSKTRQRLEGADAPTAEARTRYTAHNVLEIHQEAVETSYTKQAASGQFSSTGSAHTGAVSLPGANPVMDEHSWQLQQAIKQKARDVEVAFLNGTFQNPADNATVRRTRGLIPATTTNVSDQGTLVGDGASTIATNGTVTETSHGLSVGDPVVPRGLGTGAIGVLNEDHIYYVKTAPDANTFTLAATPAGATITFAATGTADFYEPAQATETMVLDLMQTCYENGGLMESETATVMVGPGMKRRLTAIFITGKSYQEMTRNVGGVNLQTFETDFGRLNIMLNRHMPSGVIQVASMEECAPRFLEIPGKGHFFVEPLAKTGAAEKDQLYGEIGLEYGNERKHAKLIGVKA